MHYSELNAMADAARRRAEERAHPALPHRAARWSLLRARRAAPTGEATPALPRTALRLVAESPSNTCPPHGC